MGHVLHESSNSTSQAAGGEAAALVQEAFEWFPYGIVVIDENGMVVAWNGRATELLGPIGTDLDCCTLIGCDGPGSPLDSGCFTALARERSEPLPEARIDLPARSGGNAVWVTVARLGETNRTVLHVRPGEPGDRRRRTVPHWVAAPKLKLYTLGTTRVMSRESALTGRWLDGRAGQILKVLATERHRVVQSDELVDAIWPGSDLTARDNVRYFVHTLRERLEPGRPKRAPSAFIVSRQGGYTLNLANVWLDAEVFEADLKRGIAALRHGERAASAPLLRQALGMYKGDFLADEPYAAWAIRERDRLRDLASDGLRALVRLSIEDGALDEATELTARLADMHPFDEDVQRQTIAMALARGRRSDALRQYAALRARIQSEFDEEPSFAFEDVRDDEILIATRGSTGPGTSLRP
ncbi:MAG: hypothetical protein QOJ21_2989 [Solirubrobacteraceae bacterium]|jgi:DNA-binding SARP family transcriptional activator|nr:hypothetical protein [Solirubrobacteraceae bacterium]